MAASTRFAVLQLTLAIVLAAGTQTWSDIRSQRSELSQFRGRTVLIPVDVRVVDSRGEPVRGLVRDDFAILEDGRPQEIVHFAVRDQTDDSAAPVLSALSGLGNVDSLAPASHRTFVIVLGRGRLNGPSDGVDALIDWLRTTLLAQDRVGLVAYGRMLPLSTDRSGLVRFLQTYAKRHEEIEARLDHWFGNSPLQLRHGSAELPPGIEGLIEALFEASGTEATPELLPGLGVLDVGEFAKTQARLDALLGVRLPIVGEDDGPSLASVREGYDDLKSLFGTLEALRALDGEKHILYVTEHGLQLAPPSSMGSPGQLGAGLSDMRADPDVTRRYGDLASLAADARVAVSVIQTGGIPFEWRDYGQGRVAFARTWDQLFALTDSRSVAKDTGGVISVYRYASHALQKIDRITRHGYVLGYYQDQNDRDGTFRNIQVLVDRTDLRLYHRSGYFAREEPARYDRRTFLARNRIIAAAAHPRPVRGLVVEAVADRRVTSGTGQRFEVEVRLPTDGITFREVKGVHVGALNVGIFAADANFALVGEKWDVIDLSYDGPTLRRMRDGEVMYAVLMSAGTSAVHLKVVVYDYQGDRLGTTTVKVR